MHHARGALAAELERLLRAAGSPSYQALESLGGPPRSTVNNWITGASVPREPDQLLRLIDAIGRAAPEVPPDLLDRGRWRVLLGNVRAEETAVRRGTALTGRSEPVPDGVGGHLPPNPRAAADGAVPDPWQSHATWFLGQIRADRNPRVCIVGAVDSGKSSFFRLLAQDQPHLMHGFRYAYWRLTADREATSGAGFWVSLSQVLGLTEVLNPQTAVRRLPEALAERYADDGTRVVVLVLDEWDDAQWHADGFVDAVSVSRLVQFVHSDQMHHERPVRLGLCYITRFPSIHYLTRFARRSNSKELVRLSGELAERGFVPARFPFLDREPAAALLAALGCPGEDAEEVLGACGGWAGLLASAVRRIGAAGRWGAAARSAVLDDLELMLDKTLLPEVMDQARLTDREAAWARILRDIDAGADPPGRYGLPTAFEAAPGTGTAALPGLLRAFLAPPVDLVVDLENLCMRFKLHFDRDPVAYPTGLLNFWRSVLPAAIAHAAREYDIPATNVVIAAKSKERAYEVLGPLPTGWRALPPGIRVEAGHPSEADDKVAVGYISGGAGANPAARFVLLSEDSENLGILRALHVANLVAWTPFEAPRGTKAAVAESWTVRENLLPAVGVARPPVNPSK
ncbi:hypothetical protein [Virgisporangium ochraceum]|uniref:Uncharacterized protein n=1 Tax=Virgisporangium ochraceum TaxID=65505 RepID=A0A8J4A4L9_9ACTN|nr:hypothetical protein [Virgisporangium ochraceum]GIJ74823.1 hypothetical protein Voc01_097400 [Virgisporangium ochraceum]